MTVFSLKKIFYTRYEKTKQKNGVIHKFIYSLKEYKTKTTSITLCLIAIGKEIDREYNYVRIYNNKSIELPF